MEDATADVVAAIAARHAELEALVDDLEEADLRSPSALPGWDRLTILCHLRYGAEASVAITEAALRGEPAAFYPEGREAQRPWTLLPRPGEGPFDVVRETRRAASALDDVWAGLGPTDWDVVAVEPDGNADLGAIPLGVLALLRLTEVEVHGTDLMVGAGDWSETFVSTVLPLRLRWLQLRRSNHGEVDTDVRGSWAFRPDEGDAYVVRLDDAGVSVAEGSAGADVEFAARGDTLLGFLLGRIPMRALRVDGDADVAAGFARAFPGP